MPNVPKPEAASNDRADDATRRDPLLTIARSALSSWDNARQASMLASLSYQVINLDEGAWAGVRADAQIIQGLDDGAAAALAAAWCATCPSSLVALAEMSTCFAGLSNLYAWRVFQSTGWPTCAPVRPEFLPLEDSAESWVIESARQLRLRTDSHILRSGRSRAPAEAPTRGERHRASDDLEMIARAVDAVVGSWDARAVVALLYVAQAFGWGRPAYLEETLTHSALPAMLARATPDDDGAALVRRALGALGHRPDDFAAAARATRNRAAKAEALARWRAVAPERFRRDVRRAVALAGGVNGAAAKKLGVKVDALRELVAGDPVLASELLAANASKGG